MRLFIGEVSPNLRDSCPGVWAPARRDFVAVGSSPLAGLRTARRAITLFCTLSTTVSIDSCSQKRRTNQPASLSRRTFSRSLAKFDLSFRRHQSLFVAGQVACIGHPCQKHP